MEILRRNISRCFPFTRWGSILSPPGVSSPLVIKKTLEGAESAAKGAPDRARQRRDGPGGPGCRHLSRCRLAPARFHRALLPAGTRADPAPCDRSPCFARAVPGAGPGPAPPARPRGSGGPATCALTAARAGMEAAGKPGPPPAVPGRGCPSGRCPAPSRGQPGAPARSCPSAALTSALRRESPRHLAHSMPAEDGRTDERRCQRCPRQDTGGCEGVEERGGRGGAATRER